MSDEAEKTEKEAATETPETEAPETPDADPDAADTQTAGEDPPVFGEPAPPTYEELEEQAKHNHDQWMRALAEVENTRRRAEREKADAGKYAITGFARAIVGVADNLHRALESVTAEAREASEDLKNLCVGIELTQSELLNAFEQVGIKQVDALGKKFDHNFHQAMFEVEDPSQPAGLVVQEVQKGYVIHDRLLRPAMVGVSKGGPKLEAEPEPDDGGETEKGDGVAPPTAAAYEKQADAADKEADGAKPAVDKEL